MKAGQALRKGVQSPNLLSILLLVPGGCFVVSAWNLRSYAAKLEVLGPAGFPLVISSVWVILLAAMIVRECVASRGSQPSEVDVRDIRTIRTALVIVCTLIYVAVVGKVGFVLTSAVYQLVLMIALGATKKGHVIIAFMVSALSIFSIYMVYTLLFKLPLPGGY